MVPPMRNRKFVSSTACRDLPPQQAVKVARSMGHSVVTAEYIAEKAHREQTFETLLELQSSVRAHDSSQQSSRGKAKNDSDESSSSHHHHPNPPMPTGQVGVES